MTTGAQLLLCFVVMVISVGHRIISRLCQCLVCWSIKRESFALCHWYSHYWHFDVFAYDGYWVGMCGCECMGPPMAL